MRHRHYREHHGPDGEPERQRVAVIDGPVALDVLEVVAGFGKGNDAYDEQEDGWYHGC